MKTKRLFVLAVLFTITLHADPPATFVETSSTVVTIQKDAAFNALQQLVGAGIAFPGGATAPAKGKDGEIVWVKSFDQTDHKGWRHTFFQQHLKTGTATTPLWGGTVGLHFSKTGELSSVLGNQFVQANVRNRVTKNKKDALRSAYEKLKSRQDIKKESVDLLSAAELAIRLSETELKLISLGNGMDFRYAYVIPAFGKYGDYLRVTIDAATDEVIHVRKGNGDANCNPTEPRSDYAAVGSPVRSSELPGVTRPLFSNGTSSWGRSKPGPRRLFPGPNRVSKHVCPPGSRDRCVSVHTGCRTASPGLYAFPSSL